MLLGSWVLVELLEVDSGIPDWWMVEGWKLVDGGIPGRRWNFGLVEGGG